jgi:signal transduction histidine kinase
LEVRNKKLIEYAYFNAHEVRGPLARILGLAYLVKSRPEDNPLDMIEKIEFSANELDKVIRDINQSLSNEERR